MDITASNAVMRGDGDGGGGISISISSKDLCEALSPAVEGYLRAATVPVGHVLKLCILVFALGGCVMVQCCVVAWLFLVFVQARVMVGAAGVLRAGLEGVGEEVEEEEGEVQGAAEDAEILKRIQERESGVREGMREAERAEEDQRIQRGREVQAVIVQAERLKELERLQSERERRRAARAAIAEAERREEERQMHEAREEPVPSPPTPIRAPLGRIEKKSQEQTSWLENLKSGDEQSPRKALEHRKPIPSEWKITPEALQEARSFANEATRGDTHRRPAQAQQQHQKRPSTTPRAKPPPPIPTPTQAAPKPAHSQQPSQTIIPPHLRKFKDSHEDKENASPPPAQPDLEPLPDSAPAKHFSISEMKALNPAAAAIVRPAKTPTVPPGFQAMAADPRRHQESFDALLSPVRSDVEVARAETAEVIADVQASVPPVMQVSAEEVEKRKKAVVKARALYQDALNYFQLDMARGGGKGGDRRLKRAEAYYRQKKEALREMAPGDGRVREGGEGVDLIELE